MMKIKLDAMISYVFAVAACFAIVHNDLHKFMGFAIIAIIFAHTSTGRQ